MKTKAPKCPKCGHVMYRSGKTPGGKQRWKCTGGERGGFCYTTTDGDAKTVRKQDGSDVPEIEAPKTFKRPLYDAKIFVITAAQNATPVHEKFWASLIKYCEYRDAELLVVPIRYKNATSQWTASQANEEWWFDKPYLDVESQTWVFSPKHKYLWNTRRKLNENLILLGDVRTQPTAVNPLDGFEAVTHGESGIIGHTKLQLKTIPTPQGKLPKILTTTGACTVRNYTDSKAGKLGEFHHTLGAVVVEIVGKTFHIRQINAEKDTGEFFDCPSGSITKFTPDAVYTHDAVGQTWRAAGLVMGDTHIRGIDPDVERVTFTEIIPQLDPEVVVYHDLFDGKTVNHHTDWNPFVTEARYFSNNECVEKEVREAFEFVQHRLRPDQKAVIVRSNHNDWLHRWIKDKDWRDLPAVNKKFYLATAFKLAEASEAMDPDKVEQLDAFVLLAREYFKDHEDVRVLDYDESFKIVDIECGLHGHLGPNGAQGNIKNYRRMGVKTIAGDCHSPGIDEGAYRAGTSTLLKRGYNPGPSGWLNTHVVVYPNGKRSLLNIINASWRI